MNILRDIPYIVTKPNRPAPSPVMRPFVAAALSLLLALTAFSPAAAASDAAEIRGFGGATMDTIIVIASFDAGDDASARTAMRMLDDRMIEDSFGAFVVESEPLTRSMLRGVGADSGHMFALVMDDFTPALLVIISVDSTIYMIMQGGDTLDGELMADITYDVAQDGVGSLSAPQGYIEMPMDLGDDAGFPALGGI